MSPELKLEQFEGPLDLLLQLIEEEKLKISEIAISKVTEQFFLYLDKLEKNRSEELADFLVIAAKLVFIKSKNLLPHLSGEEDGAVNLADQLKLYKRFVDASKIVLKQWEKYLVSYGRIEPPLKTTEFSLPLNVNLKTLRESYLNLLKRIKPADPLPEVKIDHTISIKHKLDCLINVLKQNKKLSFNEILKQAKNKTEIIVSFLAILELAKKEDVKINQESAYMDLVINQV